MKASAREYNVLFHSIKIWLIAQEEPTGQSDIQKSARIFYLAKLYSFEYRDICVLVTVVVDGRNALLAMAEQISSRSFPHITREEYPSRYLLSVYLLYLSIDIHSSLN